MTRQGETEALVIRTYDIGETDKIVLLLTPNDGLVRAIAKGIRRPGSRFGGALELHAFVRVALNRGATFAYITQAELLNAHRTIAQHWQTATCAAALAEAMGQIAQEDHRDILLFDGHLNVLSVLNNQPIYPVNILDAALLRLAASQGVSPVLDRCAQGDGNEPAGFSVPHGGMVCAIHLPGSFARLNDEERMTFRYLALAPWPQVGETWIPTRPGLFIYRWVETHLHLNLRAWSTIPRPAN